MSFDIRHAVYCAICGAPFNYDTDHGILYHHHEDHETGTLYRPRGRFTEDHLTWLNDNYFVGRKIYQPREFFKVANGWRGDRGCLPRERPGIGMPDLIPAYRHMLSPGVLNFASFPIHDACISIAKRVLKRRGRNGGGRRSNAPLSLEELYDGINMQSMRTRFKRALRGGKEYPSAVNWPQDSYGAKACQGRSWIEKEGTEWLCANPEYIRSLTTCVLKHLEPVQPNEEIVNPSTSRDHVSNRSHLESLPTEMMQQIAAHLPFPSVISLCQASRQVRSRILSQTAWRDALLRGDAVGYLWDLKKSVCQRKEGSAEDWDWYGLARKLAQQDVFEVGNGFEDAPLGLRNRQRVWKILMGVERADPEFSGPRGGGVEEEEAAEDEDNRGWESEEYDDNKDNDEDEDEDEDGPELD